jgi:hypothetical protein
MASLSSYKANSQRHRQVMLFDDRSVTSVGWSNEQGGSLTISLPANVITSEDADRNYRLAFNPRDIVAMVKGVFAMSAFPRAGNPNFAAALDDAGIELEMWRYPLNHFLANKGYIYVRAVNKKHALYLLERGGLSVPPISNPDASKLVEVDINFPV